MTLNETTRVMSWLNQAMWCNVNEICLVIFPADQVDFVIPLELLWCESLRYLTIELNNGGTLEWPSPYGLSHLRKLHLKDLNIDGESLGEWISSSCKFLEHLVLDDISRFREFKISSSSLVHIDINGGFWFGGVDMSVQSLHTIGLRNLSTGIGSTFNIQAPNLLNLCTSSQAPFRYFCVNKSISNHYVRLSLYPRGPRNPSELQHLLSNIVQATDLITDVSSIQKVNLHTEFEQTPRRDVIFREPENILIVDDMKVEVVEIDISRGKYKGGLVECLLENAKRLTKMAVSSKNTLATEVAHKLMGATSKAGFQ
ncbi:hypothetical protein ACFE04_032002 [Oxalis oulophora]